MGGCVMGTDTPLSPPETRATAQPAGLTLEQYADAKRLPVEKLPPMGPIDAGREGPHPVFGH